MDVKKQKNVALLLFLSDYKPTNQKAVYRFVNGDEYEGIQTNDAPVECLLKLALTNMAGSKTPESGAKFILGQDKKLYIFCITSYKVTHGEGITAWANFQDTLMKLQEKYVEIDKECQQDLFEFIPIPYDYGDDDKPFTDESEDTSQMAQRIFGEISGRLEDNDIREVYVDYTGGMRDINFLMTTIIRYLEFKGINCQKVVYSQYDKDLPENNRIRDITYIYEMFQMINGVNEFITTGHATALNEVFKSERDKALGGEEKEEHKEVKKLLENMVAFSNAMSICDVRYIDTYLKEIKDSIDKLNSGSKNDDPEDQKNSDDHSLKVAMLKPLLSLMEEKLYLNDLVQKDYYLKLIKWCLGNNMLQQALTLIEDKMPAMYIGEEDPNKTDTLITYKFIPNNQDNNEAEFLEILGHSWDKEVNKIFYFLDHKRDQADAPNILSDNKNGELGELSRYCEKLKDLIKDVPGQPEDQSEVLEIKYNKYSYKGHRQYKNQVKHTVLKCLDDNILYTVTGEIFQNNKKVSVTRTAHITMRCKADVDVDKLKPLFYLHKLLKQERNDCNHASGQSGRLSFDAIKKLIKFYIEKAEEVL